MIAQCKNFAKTMARNVTPRLFFRLQMRRRLRSADAEPELHVLRPLVTSPGTSVDIGASEGVYSHVLAGLSRRVHAFEPNPDLYRRLLAAVPDNVTVHNAALSDRSGVATLRLPLESGLATIETANLLDPAETGPISTMEVETRTLDSFGLADVRLIKIDVEGHEGAVIRGASQTIAAHRPVLIVEIEERHKPGGLGDVQQLPAEQGYHAWFLYSGRLRPIADFVPAQHQDLARSDQPYIHNFMFLPAGMTPPPSLA
jgi:FkbM family methyltransferase